MRGLSVSEVCFGSVAKVEHPRRYLKLATKKKQTHIIMDQRRRFCISSIVSSCSSILLLASNCRGPIRVATCFAESFQCLAGVILPAPNLDIFPSSFGAGNHFGLKAETQIKVLQWTLPWHSGTNSLSVKGLELDFYHLNSARQTESPSA